MGALLSAHRKIYILEENIRQVNLILPWREMVCIHLPIPTYLGVRPTEFIGTYF